MRKNINIILFHVNKIDEENFTAAANLIEKIECGCDFHSIQKIFGNEIYNKVCYKRIQWSDEDINLQTMKNSSIVNVVQESIVNNILNVKIAKERNEKFFYFFYYNKCEEIRPYLTDLQFFFLLKQKFSACRLIINDNCEKSKDYFTISHFLYFETLKDKDAVWYKINNNYYQCLQLEGVGALTKFVPLMEINLDAYNILSSRISELWNDEKRLIIPSKSEYTKKVFMKVWQSCMTFLHRREGNNEIYFDELDEYKGLSFLAFYIFLMYKYYLNKTKKTVDDKTLKLFTLEVSDGILQLVENVCLHSSYKKGFLSLVINHEDKFDLQVNVVDYTVSNPSLKNMSILNHKFCQNLEDNDELKKYFELATLKDFFSPEFLDEKVYLQEGKFYGNYWDQYYEKAENAAFHYGLQVFASIVKGYFGSFYVRSGYDYIYSANQIYYFNAGKGEKHNKDTKQNIEQKRHVLHFPGTHFMINFPINMENTQKNIGFNSKISDEAFRDILQYSVTSLEDKDYINLIAKLNSGKEKTQNEKEVAIKRVKDYITSLNKKFFANEKYSITRIPFNKFISGQMMEYFCKALFLYIKEQKTIMMKIAIVGCSDECMLEFVRWFLIFYDKQNNCKEMEHVEIYLVGTDSREDFLLSGTSLAISQGRVEKVCMSKGVFNHRQRIISQAIWRNVNDKSNFIDEEYEIIPYDIIVRYNNKEKIFENAVLKTLDTNMQSYEFGCKVEKSHVRIGSKIHITDNFYEAHSLFHSNYYTSRFAFLLSQKMMNNLIKEKGEKFCEALKQEHLLIVGYETYSELLICETKKILRNSFGFLHVDHVIFDAGSGEAFRLWNPKYEQCYYINIVPINSTLSTHNKMISLYKNYNMDEIKILANYAMILIRDSKVNEENNFKRIEVGEYCNQKINNNISCTEKKYWSGIDIKNKKVYTPLVKKEVDYIILIENNWKLPLECNCCYPGNMVEEAPLIETNKASVVPSFMIGIKPEKEISKNKSIISTYYKKINNMRLKSEIIDSSVLHYAHIYRNGNDYRFYINSENLYKRIEKKDKKNIDDWCIEVKSILRYKTPRSYLVNLVNAMLDNKRKNGMAYKLFIDYKNELEKMSEEMPADVALAFLEKLKNAIFLSNLQNKNGYYESIEEMEKMIKIIPIDEKLQSYDIIVSPVHHSNATWIDQVTENIFENMPAILHFDVQKEFRDNMKTKYSNLTALYNNLCLANKKFEINFHFVDDTIISGKTFNRAKTLIQSLFPLEAYNSVGGERPRVNLFKSVILLFNRMSSSSKLLYVNQGMFFSYINIFVPNLRNHEDACIMCKLVSDMKKLKRRSATNLTAEFFERKEIKFIRMNEIDYDKYFSEEEKKKKLEQRNYKRLYCNHRIFEEINEIGDLKNDTNELCQIMLDLINEKIQDKTMDYDEKMEWVISYFKVYSRPVITYRKSFLEAYFKIAISMIEILCNKHNNIVEMDQLKNFYYEFIQKSENKEKLLDAFIKALIGGLGKVKSNYIIRSNQIVNIFNWYAANVTPEGSIQYNNFQEWYIYIIKRLIELSGDETKCLWIEKLLLEGGEWKSNIVNRDFYEKYGIGTLFGKYLYLENTRLIYDAVSDLNKNFYDGKDTDILKDEIARLLQVSNIDLTHYYVDNFFALIRLNKTFHLKGNGNVEETYDEDCAKRVTAMVKMYNHLNRKSKSQKDNKGATILEDVTQIGEDYVKLLDYMKEASGAIKVFLYGADKQEDRLKIIKEELLKRCELKNIPYDSISDVLEMDKNVRLKLYSIASSSAANKKEKYSDDTKNDLIYAEKLLMFFESYCPDVICIGKTIVIDFSQGRALLKIHNNWGELKEECQKKNVNKIHVDPFYFYFDFSNSNNDEILRGLRNILTFRDSLVRRIEEDFNNNLIQLTVSSQKQAKDLSNDRAAGHTKMDEIKSFMSVYIEALSDKKNNHNITDGVVMGNMIKLLADSYCSHMFRELYPKAEEPLKLEDVSGSYSLGEYKKSLTRYSHVFRNCVFSKILSGTKQRETIHVEYNINEENIDIINLDFEEIWVLFLVLLIQNALIHGIVEDGKRSAVKIYRENRYIVVQNKIDAKITDIEEINKLLKRVPEGKAEGISLWVMDQSIRYYWRRYYWCKYIKEWDGEEGENIRRIIKKLLELESCCIVIEKTQNGKEIKIKLPLIFEKENE